MPHNLTPLDEAPSGRQVRIGWDGPLSTFFLQVLDKEMDPMAEDDFIHLVWKGIDPHEFSTPEELISIASRYAVIPDDLGIQLVADKQNSNSSFSGRVGTHLVGESVLHRITDIDQAAQIFVSMNDTPKE